jgi:small subunit ribosomal protein S9
MAETKVESPDTKLSEKTADGARLAGTRSQPKPLPNATGGAKGGYWWGTGRRKSSVARVRIKPGTGKILINKMELNDYFTREQDRKAALAPLRAVGVEKSFDVFVNVRGGGITGQAGATLLGVARALKGFCEIYAQALRDGGYLTRDPRMVERKKPGQAGARKRFQFSKR